MKKLRLISFVLILILLITGCGGNKIGAQSTGENLKEDKGTFVIPEQAEENKVALPVLVAPNKAELSCGTYYSNISYERLVSYLEELKVGGWECINCEENYTKIVEEITDLMLTDGENLLQLVISLESKEETNQNSVMVRLDQGISGADIKAREGALNKEEAKSKIEPILDEMVRNGELSKEKREVIGLLELYIEDSYEKMGLQAFAVVSATGITGQFLICKDSVLNVMSDLGRSVVADLDQNGEYELLDMFGFGSGIYRITLTAYEYSNPIYFSSLTKVLHIKYQNVFVPNAGYAELDFKKVDDNKVLLIGSDMEYGEIMIDESYLIPKDRESFPFKEWRASYDQKQLLDINKTIPEHPPKIDILIDGQSIEYQIQQIKWDGIDETVKSSEKIFSELIDSEKMIPTYKLNHTIESSSSSVQLDFGEFIPDSIRVEDMMLNDGGGIRYGNKLILEREVEIIDDRKVQFALVQHMAYYLSSNSVDYEKDWYRLFRIYCIWQDKECVYHILINTV